MYNNFRAGLRKVLSRLDSLEIAYIGLATAFIGGAAIVSSPAASILYLITAGTILSSVGVRYYCAYRREQMRGRALDTARGFEKLANSARSNLTQKQAGARFSAAAQPAEAKRPQKTESAPKPSKPPQP